jgi:hypothetical protein
MCSLVVFFIDGGKLALFVMHSCCLALKTHPVGAAYNWANAVLSGKKRGKP